MQADRIATLLPELYRGARRQGSVLEASLAVMESLHEPVEASLSALDAVFDPRRAADPFVVMLAGWLGLDALLDVPPAAGGGERRSRMAIDPAHLRELVAEAAGLARIRGTLEGMRRLLELATGLQGFEFTDSPPDPMGVAQPFTALLSAPPGADTQSFLIGRIVSREKPAFVVVAIHYRVA